MTGHRRSMLLLLTLSGLVLGLVGDAVAGGVDLSFGNLLLAVVMSPLLAVVGGGAVSLPGSEAFLIGGLLFWPVWGLLAWRWLKKERSVWLGALIVAWSTQGFFQITHRLAMVMSA